MKSLSVINLLLVYPIWLSIFLVPFDSVPFLPISSVYRPICIIPLFLVFFYIVFTKSFHKRYWLLFGVCFFLVVQSSFMVYFYHFPTDHLPKMLLTLVLMFLTLISIHYFFCTKDVTSQTKRVIIAQASFVSLTISFSFCVLQFLGKYFELHDVSSHLTSYVSYRSVGRIQGVSGEPAQFVRNVIFLGLLSVAFNRGLVRLLAMTMSLFCLLISGSTYGYIILVLGGLLYIFLFDIKVIMNKGATSFFAISLVVFFLFYNNLMGSYTKNKINKFVRIIKNPKEIEQVLVNDSSIFQRVMNPYIAFTSKGVGNVAGTGLDTYRYIYPDQIIENYPYALCFHTVSQAVVGGRYITPKSLYGRIYIELGWGGFVTLTFLYIYFYYQIIKTKQGRHSTLLGFSFVVTLIYPMNTDSIIFFNYLFLMVLIWCCVRGRLSLCDERYP